MNDDYDRRSDALWATIDEYDEDVFRARVEELVAEPAGRQPGRRVRARLRIRLDRAPGPRRCPSTGGRSSSGSTADGAAAR